MIKKCPVIALRIVCKLNDHKYQFYRKKHLSAKCSLKIENISKKILKLFSINFLFYLKTDVLNYSF